MLFEESGIPQPATGDLDRLQLHGVRGRGLLEPSPERTPHLLRFARAQALEDERDVERVPPADANLFAPVLVAEPFPIEDQEALDQLREGCVAVRDDAAVHCAEKIRKRMRLQGDAG